MSDMQIIVGPALMLARIGGMLVYVPIPGTKSAPPLVKTVLAICLSVALLPEVPAFRLQPAGFGQLFLWLVGEMIFGLMVGLFIGFLSEGLSFGLQAIAVQAGFSYASTIDPNNETDSGILQALAQIISSILFFQYSGDGVVIRAFSRSLTSWPPGGGVPGWPALEALAAFGSAMFELGLRLALPVAALLLLADISLALMARIQSQLQLLSLAFPVKMLGSLVLLAMILPVAPALYRIGMHQVIRNLGLLVK